MMGTAECRQPLRQTSSGTSPYTGEAGCVAGSLQGFAHGPLAKGRLTGRAADFQVCHSEGARRATEESYNTGGRHFAWRVSKTGVVRSFVISFLRMTGKSKARWKVDTSSGSLRSPPSPQGEGEGKKMRASSAAPLGFPRGGKLSPQVTDEGTESRKSTGLSF